ncbi:MAG: hypothetical protein KZQ91_04470 [Candidatus Thiodiazotropha sp. (ex Lucinoma borealis)]|nr:hypothetical protein [Candidatus Thiodiazotropha sp. (ex Lucinoma borealis)]
MTPLRYNSLFISDTHLGLHATRTEYLLDFLKHTESDNLYLVGNILDIWKMRSDWYWPSINNEIIYQVIDKAKRGTVRTLNKTIDLFNSSLKRIDDQL